MLQADTYLQLHKECNEHHTHTVETYDQYCDRVDEELSKGETKYPGVGIILMLVVGSLFWGAAAYMFWG